MFAFSMTYNINIMGIVPNYLVPYKLTVLRLRRSQRIFAIQQHIEVNLNAKNFFSVLTQQVDPNQYITSCLP